jgi:hypothetical protein
MATTHSEQRYWFRAKRYGWGWTPCTWQGWTVLAVWAVVFTALVTGCAAAASASNGALFALLLAFTIASTLALVGLCWRKGEPPQFRWGGR